jgi:hypothetical protein
MTLQSFEGFNSHCDWCGEYADECKWLPECVLQDKLRKDYE